MEMNDYQKGLIETAREQRAFVEELESSVRLSDRFADKLEESRTRPLQLTIGGGMTGGDEAGGGVLDGNSETADRAERVAREALARRLETIREGFLTERELEIEHFAVKNETLREALEMEMLTKQEFLELEVANQAAHTARLNELHEAELAKAQQVADEKARAVARSEDYIRSQQVASLQNGVRLLQTMGQKSKAAAIAAVALNAGLQIAQTIQNTATAQMRAIAELGPIAGPPMAATIGAWGAANVALIAAQSVASAAAGSGGAGSGGRGGGGSPAATAPAAPQQQQTVTVQGLNRDQLFTGDQIVELLNEAQKRGARIVTTG
jgi:hypothetical protein